MARPAYSACLWRGAFLSFGPTSMGGPPLGFKWDLRDITMYNTGGTIGIGSPLHGFEFYDDVAVRFWAVRGPLAQPLVAYHWQGRQIIEDGQFLNVLTHELDWMARVCGYVLSV